MPDRKREAHLNDFLVRHTSQEDVLLVFVRMETNDVWYLPISKALDALSCLCVPELHGAIVGARQELTSVIRKAYVLHSLGMAIEGTETVPVGVDIPELAAG